MALLGALAAGACSRQGCREGCAVCGGSVWLGSRVVEHLTEESRQREACGQCPAGTVCHLMYEPAECRPRFGAVGDRCGSWRRSSRPGDQFRCAGDLHCWRDGDSVGRCREPADVGMRCAIDAHCRLGLHCARGQVRTCEPPPADAGPDGTAAAAP